nr:MAG TPA: hypothetical protein [Caudoviricetes sp.]
MESVGKQEGILLNMQKKPDLLMKCNDYRNITGRLVIKKS